jgi:putative ABC transport system permease protein
MAHDWKALVARRLVPLPLDPARAADVVDELAQHVAEHHADLVARGVPDEEALGRALAPLANGGRVARDIARADRPRSSAPAPPPALPHRAGLLADLWRDLRYAARLLIGAPGFAAAAVLTLALGIGANATIFSVVNAVLLRSLPYADADRLVRPGDRGADGAIGNVGYLTFLDWRSETHSFTDMAAIRSWSVALPGGDGAELVNGLRVTANFLHLLGVTPALGRDFDPADDTPARWRKVVLSDAFWRRRFGADPDVIGRTIALTDRPFTIVGVLPASFEPLISEQYYKRADVYGLLGYDATLPYACRDCEHLKAIARLAPGVTVGAAERDLQAVQARLRERYPTSYDRSPMGLRTLPDELAGNVRPALAALAGAVAFVLLIACANVANLLLARFARRQHDLALRTAIGASRGRIARQLFAEAVVLAAAGGSLGLLIATWGVPLVARLAPGGLLRVADAHVDARVLAFTALLSLGTTVVFGVVPAVRGASVDLRTSLHGGQRVSRPQASIRRTLIGADVALAVVLLAGAGLMIKSVGRLLAVNPGFDPAGVLTLQIAIGGPAYATDQATRAAVDRVLDGLHRLPGVHAAAAASQIPLGGNGDRWGFHIQSRPAPNPADDPSVERYGVTPEYLAAMGIPLLQGRFLNDDDRADSDPVLVVGEATARALFPRGDAIGQRVRIGGAESGPWRRIVGIVGDVRHEAMATPPSMQMYTPETQFVDSDLTLVVRGGADPALLAAEARREIASAAPGVPVYEVAPLERLVAHSVGPRRFIMASLELFALTALLMTAVGVHGVISYGVAERRREIGIRTALGASRASIMRLVLGGGLVPVASGLGAGLAIALAVTRYLRSSLYDVSARDPATLVAVALVLLAVAVAAQAIPAMRALQVDPAEVLRET